LIFKNEITATATNIEINNNKITQIKNFQIVNGGQNIYNCIFSQIYCLLLGRL